MSLSALRRALVGAALGLSALAGWGVYGARDAGPAPGGEGRVDAEEVKRGAPQVVTDSRTVSAPGPVPGGGATREVVDVVAADAVEGTAAPTPPSLVRFTPRTRAERVDVWLRFPALHVKDQLALQDQLPPDFAGPAVERGEHGLRLRGPLPAGSIFWVSQELGFLGEGAELAEPDLDRAGEVRALFVEQAADGSVHVRSSRPLAGL